MAVHPKDDLFEIVFKILENFSKSPDISCSQSILGEMIHHGNLGFN